ncbi:hypothetical protein BDD12DRAFT_226459 [Trichophaea hybrida]|nr:hypothetical protein BDD12DRAFT_226459 [Trichophaea hybrida]
MMSEVFEIQSISQLRTLQASNPAPLIVLYLGLNGVAQGTYDVFRSVAQGTVAVGRQIIFCRNLVDVDPSIQSTYGIGAVPTVIMFVGQNVVRRLDDLSERMLEKHINRHSE